MTAGLVLWWSMSDSRNLVFRGAPNERGIVRTIALLPASENNDVAPFTVSSFAGFHIVHWSRWRAGGVYIVVPLYAVFVSLASVVALTFWLTRGRAARLR